MLLWRRPLFDNPSPTRARRSASTTLSTSRKVVISARFTHPVTGHDACSASVSAVALVLLRLPLLRLLIALLLLRWTAVPTSLLIILLIAVSVVVPAAVATLVLVLLRSVKIPAAPSLAVTSVCPVPIVISSVPIWRLLVVVDYIKR